MRTSAAGSWSADQAVEFWSSRAPNAALSAQAAVDTARTIALDVGDRSPRTAA